MNRADAALGIVRKRPWAMGDEFYLLWAAGPQIIMAL